MKTCSWSHLLALAAALLGPVWQRCPAAGRTVALRSPSFEQGADPSGVPAGWSPYGGGARQLRVRVVGEAEAGQKAVRIDDGDPTTDSDQDDIWGVRFTRDGEVNSTTVIFTTVQVPVWGDFYAKDGGGQLPGTVYARNAGFGTDPTAEADLVNWIPRPNGTGHDDPGGLPEAGGLAIWSFLAFCGWAGFRMRRPAHG